MCIIAKFGKGNETIESWLLWNMVLKVESAIQRSPEDFWKKLSRFNHESRNANCTLPPCFLGQIDHNLMKNFHQIWKILSRWILFLQKRATHQIWTCNNNSSLALLIGYSNNLLCKSTFEQLFIALFIHPLYQIRWIEVVHTREDVGGGCDQLLLIIILILTKNRLLDLAANSMKDHLRPTSTISCETW